MSRTIRIFSVLIATFSLSVYFVNCAGGLPDNVNNTTASSTSTPPTTPVVQALTVSTFPNQVTTGGSSQVSVTGGTSPYTYAIFSGTGSVNSSGLVTGLAAAGSVVITVTDSKGQSALTSVYVTGTVLPTGGSGTCTTPWGVTLASGSTVTGFTTATVDCPATCTPVTVTCSNGALSGGATAGSCAVNACLYKKKVSNADCNTDPLGGTAGPIPVQLNAAPPTCPASSYHGLLCAADPWTVADEFECVSPSEAPTN